MENRETKNDRVTSKTSIARSVESNSVNYNSIGSKFSYLRSNSLETVYAFDNPSFLPDGLPSSLPGQNGIPPLPNILDNNAYYDPHDFGKEHHATSFWGTVLHIFIISAGPVVFTLPGNFLNVGLWFGLIGAFFIICLYAHNIRMFADAEYEICKKKRIPNLSYSDTVFYAFKNGPQNFQCLAPYCRFLTYVVFVVLWSGGNAFNLVLIGQNAQTVYSMLYEDEINIRTAILYMIIPLLLLCWIPNLKLLVILSTVANIVNVCLVGVVVYYIFDDPHPWHPPESSIQIQDIPIFLGSILFCINATGILMALKNDMSEPKKFNSPYGVLTVSYIPIAFLLTAFSTLCTQKYGTALQENVLSNLPQEHSFTRLIIPSFLLVICFQFPLISYVVYDILWNNILKEKRTNTRHESLKEYILRTLIVAIILIMAFTVPNLPLFLSISGTIGTPIDSMIFPAIVNTFVHFRKKNSGLKFNLILYKNGAIIAFAFALIVAGLNDCFNEISAAA